jgi:radical SAM protein with 4Fe4S-binding SPASM domain
VQGYVRNNPPPPGVLPFLILCLGMLSFGRAAVCLRVAPCPMLFSGRSGGRILVPAPQIPPPTFTMSPWKWKLARTIRVFKNTIRYLEASFEPRRWKPTAAPEVNIENTSICNSHCVFCANDIMQRPRRAMQTDVFKKAVAESVALGSTAVNFSVMIGDPLLDPQLLERARYVRSFPQVQEMGFTTTLQWLHRFDLKEFFACGFSWIAVSTILSGRGRYQSFFGVDKYDQMLTNLVRLLKENNRRNRPIEVLLSIKPTPERRKDILDHPDFRRVQALTSQKLSKEINRERFFVMDWGGSVSLPSYLRPLPLWARKRRPCGRLLRNLLVYSNGQVGACNCVDFNASSELILGSVAEASLDEMWNGERIRKIRSDWRAGIRIPDICSGCQVYRPGPMN